MGNYRQPGSLRTLAQVDWDLNQRDAAVDLAGRSLDFLPPEDQPLYKAFWSKYIQLAQQSGVDGAVADNNAGPGGLPAMRGEAARAAPVLGHELSDLLVEFSDPSSGLNINGSGLQLAKTRGEGNRSGPELQLIRRPPPRLPASFIQRAP